MNKQVKKEATGRIILIIIYDHVMRNILARILRARGNTVITCSVGFDGIRKFEKGKGKFDLVIIDISLPGMVSYSVAKKIKTMSNSTPMVLIKECDQGVGSEGSKDAGFNLVLSKPVFLDKAVHHMTDLAQ